VPAQKIYCWWFLRNLGFQLFYLLYRHQNGDIIDLNKVFMLHHFLMSCLSAFLFITKKQWRRYRYMFFCLIVINTSQP
jgi:hypothetical protein